MENIFDKLKPLFFQESKKFIQYQIPQNRVDLKYNSRPFKEGEGYCKIWLCEMYLSKGYEIFRRRYPVVHSWIRFFYNNKEITVPYLAGPDLIQELTKENLDKVIHCNHRLTPLFPYNRGEIEIIASLFSLVSKDHMDKFIKTLGRFARLLPVPELSMVLNLVEPVNASIQDLFDIGNTRFEIGIHQTFTGGSGGANRLIPGYYAVIHAEDSEIDKSTLCVIEDSLRFGKKGKEKEFLEHENTPLDGISYMLFRIEKCEEQDWESLQEIKELVEKGQEAVVKEEFDIVKNDILPAIKVAVFRSPDIAKADKKKMIMKIEAEFREYGLHSGENIAGQRSFYSIMQRELSDSESISANDMELEKFFLSG